MLETPRVCFCLSSLLMQCPSAILLYWFHAPLPFADLVQLTKLAASVQNYQLLGTTLKEHRPVNNSRVSERCLSVASRPAVFEDYFEAEIKFIDSQSAQQKYLFLVHGNQLHQQL
jgi:hypothetical protein